jgi:hypothetical protein
MLRTRSRRRRFGVAVALVAAPFVLGALNIGASTPPSGTVTVPDKPTATPLTTIVKGFVTVR